MNIENPNTYQAPQGFAARKSLPPPRIAPGTPWLDPVTRALLELPDWLVVRLVRRGLLSLAEQARYEAALMGWIQPGVPLHTGPRFRLPAPAEEVQG